MIEPVLIEDEFFLGSDVVSIAKSLIGNLLVVKGGNEVRAGIIAETEAYAGEYDKASHAYGGRKTQRTEVLYLSGGHVYVYLCYGIHHLFNIVTNQIGVPHAVLVRGILPVDKKNLTHSFSAGFVQWKGLANGPGKISRKLGIGAHHNKSMVNRGQIHLYHYPGFKLKEIVISSRVGVDYAGEDAMLPYRFYLKNYKPAKK